MLDRIKEAKMQAARAAAEAEQTADPQTRALFLQIAANWAHIAAVDTEFLDRRSAPERLS